MWSNWWFKEKKREKGVQHPMSKDSLGFIQGLQCWGGLPLQLLLLVLELLFRHLLQIVSLKAMCSQVLFHFYFSDVWFGPLSGLAFLYLSQFASKERKKCTNPGKRCVTAAEFSPVIGKAASCPILDGEGLLLVSGHSPSGVTSVFPFSAPVFYPCFCKGWEKYF